MKPIQTITFAVNSSKPGAAAVAESLAELVETLEPDVVGHIDLIRKFDGMQASIDQEAFASLDRTEGNSAQLSVERCPTACRSVNRAPSRNAIARA